MARGTQLSDLLRMLKGQLGLSVQPNPAQDGELKELLSFAQMWLGREYMWPFLENRWDVVVSPFTQYVDFPTVDQESDAVDVDLDRMPLVEVLWTTQYKSVEYGIGSEQYNSMDAAQGQYSDPIQRWRIVDELGVGNQFEVWPVPTQQQTVRFTGLRAVQPLEADTDKADLDDMLIVLCVAADKLTRAKQADAPLKTENFKRQLAILRMNSPSTDTTRMLGCGNQQRKPRLAGMKIIITR